MYFRLAITFLLTQTFVFSQDYVSWRVGNNSGLAVQPSGGVCLMGGASESDDAMRWFLQRANGGDVLVLRASGQDGYNLYFYNDLGVTLNAVETIRFNNSNASNNPYIHQRISEADAIWFAGGDQWNYVSYWRNTPIDSLINRAIQERNIVIGGTSAGMAILGEYYFSAQAGTITSSAALSNPTLSANSVSLSPFLSVPFLGQTITDTHYDNPDRKGRHIVFMANAYTQEPQYVKGIACDEYTAVCIDATGWARVFGDFPAYDDNAYFLQMNCALSEGSPETYSLNEPLTWDRNQQAIQVYSLKGTQSGQNGFNVSNWSEGNGGEWSFWSVNSGSLSQNTATEPACVSQLNELDIDLQLYPNPTSGELFISASVPVNRVYFFTLQGQEFFPMITQLNSFDLKSFPPGVYICRIETSGMSITKKIVVE
jgi:cyanophycinase-like exopeptidase